MAGALCTLKMWYIYKCKSQMSLIQIGLEVKYYNNNH